MSITQEELNASREEVVATAWGWSHSQLHQQYMNAYDALMALGASIGGDRAGKKDAEIADLEKSLDERTAALGQICSVSPRNNGREAFVEAYHQCRRLARKALQPQAPKETSDE